MTLPHDPTDSWTPVRKFIFRLVCIYFGLFMFYTLLRFQTIPVLTQLHGFFWPVWRWVVTLFNDYLLHIRKPLVEPNGSTDTSFSWASQYTTIIISLAGAAIWSVAGRRRSNYAVAEHWLRVAVRYCLAYFALYYGIIKLFALQMPFPSLSQLSTPLGDLTPTRLSWMFVGASPAYQVFSGVIETAAGLLLMYRRTSTIGAILSAAVFGNVVALNFSYDIPVKLMSAHFFLMSAYLLLFEYRKVIDFFLVNDPVEEFKEKWIKYGRVVLKLAFIYVSVVMVVILSVKTYKRQHLVVNTRPIEQGVYDVKYFSLDNDSLRWRDMVLYGVSGSIKTADTMFVQRYKRGYFTFEVDSTAHQLRLKKNYEDKHYILTFEYTISEPHTLLLVGMLRGDSLKVVLTKIDKPFTLSEPDQFHWIQELPR